MTDTHNTHNTHNTRAIPAHSAQKENDMPSNTDKSNTTTTPTAASAADFAALAMSIVASIPASTVASADDKPKGTSAANAKALVNGVDKPSVKVTHDDTQTWTFTRKSGEPTTGTWKEAQTAIRQAVTTTGGDVYMQRPTRGNVQITLHRVSLDPINAATVIARDVADVRKNAAKGETDRHRTILADMGAYLAAAFAAMSDDDRAAFIAQYQTA